MNDGKTDIERVAQSPAGSPHWPPADWERDGSPPRKKELDADNQFAAGTTFRRALVAGVLEHGAPTWRHEIALLLDELAFEVARSQEQAAKKRDRYSRVAVFGVASETAGAVLFTGGGAALAFVFKSAPAIIGGIALAIFGSVASAYGARYFRNRAKARSYEQLWWDIWNYAILVLPTEDRSAVYTALEGFTRRRQEASGDVSTSARGGPLEVPAARAT